MNDQKYTSHPFDLGIRWSRRHFLKQAGVLGISTIGFATAAGACTTTPTPTKLASPSGPLNMQTLIANAQKEGKLEAVGIPAQWANYKDILFDYTRKYVPVDYQAEATFSSDQILDVFALSKLGHRGDVGDVSLQSGPKASTMNLVAPYKHARWNDIPDSLKDSKGTWCTAYWGTQAFVVNTNLVKNPPTSFKDLLAGDYQNMVGIDGDPRQTNDAFMAAYSAAFAMTGSLKDIQPGIDFFVQLKRKGNFTLARANLLNITKGEVAIALIWDYLGLDFRDRLNGHPDLQVVIPSDGSIAGPYVSVINKTAPHPYAARLWVEYLFSDEGQLHFLQGYMHPVRYQKLVAAGKVPADLAAKLPAVEQYTNITFVTDLKQLSTAADVLAKNWQLQILGQ